MLAPVTLRPRDPQPPAPHLPTSQSPDPRLFPLPPTSRTPGLPLVPGPPTVSAQPPGPCLSWTWEAPSPERPPGTNTHSLQRLNPLPGPRSPAHHPLPPLRSPPPRGPWFSRTPSAPTFRNSRGASTRSRQLRSTKCTAPSALRDSRRTSLPRKTGICGQVGKRFS